MHLELSPDSLSLATFEDAQQLPSGVSSASSQDRRRLNLRRLSYFVLAGYSNWDLSSTPSCSKLKQHSKCFPFVWERDVAETSTLVYR